MTTAGRPPEFLKCIKCHEVFTDPVTLHCGHTFCARCIGAHAPHQHDYDDRRSVKCYLCGFSGRRPYLHNRAFFIKRLAEQYKSNGGHVVCGLCKDKRRANPAEFWCSYCGYSMCRECRDRLQLSHTTMIRPKCEKHVNFAIDMMCEDCQEAVCQRCSILDHKGCRVIPLEEALSEIDPLLTEYAEELEDKIPTLESHICHCESAAKKLHVAIYDAEKAIDETGTRFVTQIRKQQKELKEQLHRSNEKNLSRLENEVKIGKLKLQDAQQRIGFAEEAKNSASEMDHFEVYQTLRSGRESDYHPSTNGIGYSPKVRFEENREMLPTLKRERIGELRWENTVREKPEQKPKRNERYHKGMYEKQRTGRERNGVPRRDEIDTRKKDIHPEKYDRDKTWIQKKVAKNDTRKDDTDRKEKRAEQKVLQRKREDVDSGQDDKTRNVDKSVTEKEDMWRKEEKKGDRTEEKTDVRPVETRHVETQTNRKLEEVDREEDKHRKVEKVVDDKEELNEKIKEVKAGQTEELDRKREDKNGKVDKFYKGVDRVQSRVGKIDTRKKGVYGLTVFTLSGIKLIVVTNCRLSSVQSFYAENGDYTQVHDSFLSVECPAYGITKVNTTDAAMAMPQKKQIGVLQVGPKPEDRLRLVEIINFGMPYTDVTCLSNDPPNPPLLAVSGRRGNPIEIVDLSGRRLRGFGSDVFSRGVFLCSGLDDKTWISDVRKQNVVSCTFVQTNDGDWQTVDLKKHLKKKSVFRRPRGICQGAGGDIFVVERRLHRVVQLSQSGQYVRDFLTFEKDETSIPFALHVDSDNMVYVSVDDRYIQVHKITEDK